MTTDVRLGAAELLRSLGLLVDGPARWEAPVPSRSPGIFIVELPNGAESAPIDVIALRRWLERVPALTLDGAHPTPQELQRWLSDRWLASESVLYIGRSAKSLGARVSGMYATPLGGTKPHPGGHWLKTLSALRDLRVWWAETDAHEEYEDALLTAIAGRNDGRLPFANLTGGEEQSKADGLANSLSVDSATGANRPAAAAKQRKSPTTIRRASPRLKAASTKPVAEPTALTAEGLERLTAELDNLRNNVRPEVIARVKAARELGDLKENGDYEYARKEQSFVEGRIQAVEAILRNGVVVDEGPIDDRARLGSKVTIETEGERLTYVLVGSAEANAGAGRISNISPVGRALVGARAGDNIVVQLPGGVVDYLVIEVK
jgi:transcription elongation factor GreA